MRTLTLLTALLLLAFQTRAQTLDETADQVPAHDQPGAQDQDLFGDEDQDVAASFTREERFTRKLLSPGTLKKIIQSTKKILQQIAKKIKIRIPVESCLCRPQHQCPQSKVNNLLQRGSWICKPFGYDYKLCCK